MTDSTTHNSFALLKGDVASAEPYEPRIEQLRRPTPPPTPPTPEKRTDLSCLSRPVRFVANDTILLRLLHNGHPRMCQGRSKAPEKAVSQDTMCFKIRTLALCHDILRAPSPSPFPLLDYG